MCLWCKIYGSKGVIYTTVYSITWKVVTDVYVLRCVHPCLVKISSEPNSSWNILFSVILVYLVLIFTSDHNLTTCQEGGETSTNREQLNKLTLCCQVLGGRQRQSGLKKELKPLLQRLRNPRGWGVRRKREIIAKVGKSILREEAEGKEWAR